MIQMVVQAEEMKLQPIPASPHLLIHPSVQCVVILKLNF